MSVKWFARIVLLLLLLGLVFLGFLFGPGLYRDGWQEALILLKIVFGIVVATIVIIWLVFKALGV